MSCFILEAILNRCMCCTLIPLLILLMLKPKIFRIIANVTRFPVQEYFVFTGTKQSLEKSKAFKASENRSALKKMQNFNRRDQ